MKKTDNAAELKREQNKEQKNTQKTGRKKSSSIFGIRNKIILCFLVPIVFMILVGFVAYNKAEEGLETNFRDSTLQTLNMAVEYIEMGCDFAKNETTKYAVNDDLNKYSFGLLKNKAQERANVLSTLRSSMLSSQNANPFINQIHIVTGDQEDMLSTKLSGEAGILDAYVEEQKDANGKLPTWTDYHGLLDKQMTMTNSEYILAYQAMSQSKNFCIVIDVKKSAIQDFLDQMNLGEGSVIGFVTMNGREVISERKESSGQSVLVEGEPVFYGREYMPAEGAEDTGVKDIQYNGRSYLFLYSKSNETGCLLCAMVPRDLIMAQADDIKQLTIMISFFAVLIVLLVGIMIVIGIQKNMKRISKTFGEVAKGDLTVLVKATGRDEFRDLAGSATDMISNTKKLVNKVKNATEQLEVSSEDVTRVSGVISDYSQDITTAIQDINEGMARQSTHAQECVDKTEILSTEIQGVGRIVERVGALVNQTEEMINQGMNIVHALGSRAQETTEITEKVGESIASLKEESEIINSFVATITDISTQTNLLSLNASIEAARAGEAGRGFAVVAEEIRHLADDSAKAAGEISNNVEHISAQTLKSVQSANEAQAMVALQTEAVEQVVEVFKNMQQRMQELVGGLKEIVAGIESADREREETVYAVKNITDIIEKTASNTEAVNEVADKLLENVENLHKTADVLGENMVGLKTEISVFRI